MRISARSCLLDPLAQGEEVYHQRLIWNSWGSNGDRAKLQLRQKEGLTRSMARIHRCVFNVWTATLVSSQPRSNAHISNDEFELLEDHIAEESSPQTLSHNGHSRSSDQATDHGPQVDNETPFYGVHPGRTM